MAIGKIKIPVGVFNIVHHIANRHFKIQLTDVGIESGENYAVEVFRSAVRSGNSIECHAIALEQWMTEFGFDIC